jgi:hypothetical protein
MNVNEEKFEMLCSAFSQTWIAPSQTFERAAIEGFGD